MSWINWYYGVSDQNWLLRRMYEEDRILKETWNRQHTSKEEAEDIPPDYDEFLEVFGHISRAKIEQNIIPALQPKPKKSKERKLRIPIQKRLKVQLIRERGGICERCKETPFHHFHHIDGNPSNNLPTNLLLVCYECHMELERK